MFSKNKRIKQKVSTVRDAFRVEALESRVLLSADPIIGLVHIILPGETSPDHVAIDAYQTTQAPDGGTPPAMGAPQQGAVDTHLLDLAMLVQSGASVAAVLDSSVLARVPGGALSFVPLDAGGTIVLANGAWTGTGADMQLDSAALGQRQEGVGEIVLGSIDGHHLIYIGQAGATDAVTLNDTLHLINPQLGGEIFINADLNLNNGSSLVIDGSGHTSTFAANVVSTDDILVNDSVRFDGLGISLTAGSDGTGNIHLGFNATHIFQGNLDGSPDSAILRAPGNITIGGNVGGASLGAGGLAGLTIEGVDVAGTIDTPNDVTFSESVIINGDFIINASGVVTFAKSVTLTNGGDFSIFGATQVIFQGGVVLSGGGDLFIEANEVTFSGGGESVVGTGTMTLRPTTVGLAIELGSPPNGNTADTLNIDNNEIATFADGFSKIIIGHQTAGHATAGAGAVRIGAIGAVEQPTLRDNVEVYGASIAVEDFSSPTLNYTLLVSGTIKLDAVGDIAIYNQVEARNGTLQNITLYSASGAIAQVDFLDDGVGGEALRGASLDAHAALGISLVYTELGSVSAQNTGASGDIVIHETALGGDLLLTLVNQSNVAGSGAIDIRTASGAMTVLASGSGVVASGTGDLTLAVAGSAKALLVNDVVTTTSGSINLYASGALSTLDDAINDGVIASSGGAISLVSSLANISLGGNVSSAGGLVSVRAATAIAMADGKKITSQNALDSGAVNLLAGTGIALSIIEADGAMILTARNGAIVDVLTGAGPNLDGDTAQATLAATTGIGAGAGLALQTQVAGLSAANTVSGGLFIQEATALRLGSAGSFAIDLGGTSGNASITTANGALTVSGAVRSTGAVGNLLLRSGETGEATSANVELRADLTSTNGSISIVAADSIVIDNLGVGGPRLETLKAGQTLDLSAADAISMEAQAQLQTNNGNVRLEAVAGSVSVGVVNAGTSGSGGTISINAGAAITDAQDDDLAAPAGVNLAAYGLRLQAGAGIGAAGSAIETQVSVMAVAASGNAYLAERDGVAVGTVGPVSVNRVDLSGASAPVTDLAITGLNTGGGAGTNISATGNLVIDSNINAGSGNVRIDVAGALTLNASIGNGSGSITVLATNNIVQTGLGRLSTSGGTIDVESTAGAIVMANGGLAQTNAGNIRYKAATGITLGVLDARSAANRSDGLLGAQAGWGSVSVVAGGAIADLAGDTATNIYAGELRLNAVAAIGAGSEALEVEALRMSAAAAGMYIGEASNIIIDQTAAVTVNRVLADGSIAGSSVTDAVQVNLASSAALVLQAAAGSIVTGINGAISAGGNLLLAAGVDITLGGSLVNNSAGTSLVAARDIVQVGAIASAGAGASIELLASRNVVQANGSTLASTNGNVSVSAGVDATIESIAAGSGAVRVIAGNDIIDGDSAGDTQADLTAGALQLFAGNAIGSGNNALETTVAVLSARAGAAGLYLFDTDGVTVDTVSIQVSRVSATGAAAQSVNAAQSNLSATGNVVLVTNTGDLLVSDEVSSVAGSILLKASLGGITVNNAITTLAGSVSLSAAGAITQKAAISSAASVDITAGGAISMDDGVITSATGNVRYVAGGVLALGAISAANASVQGSSIIDSGAADIDVTAGSLRLATTGTGAGEGAGTGAAHLQSAVATLAANVAGAGGIYLDETDGIIIGSVAAMSVSRLAVDGTSSTLTDAALADLVSGGNLVLAGGASITVNSSLATYAVSAVGNLLLKAAGANSDLLINGALLSSAGNLSLAAGRDIAQAGAIAAIGTGKTLDLVAARNVVMAQGSLLSSNGGNIVLQAGLDATIESISAGTASVSLRAVAGSILDGDAAGDTEADILANGLQLRAGGAIGSGGNHLETTVGTLTAQAGALGMYVSETNALIVDTLTIQANRVGASGAAVATVNAAQSNLQSGGDIVLVSNAGSLAISDTVLAAGNVLLQSSTGGLVVNSAITSTGGAISLASSGTIVQHADIGVAGSGSIDLAASGSIAMDNGTRISGNANIRVAAGTVMTLGAVSTTGKVSLIAGSITDAGNVETDVTASQLRLATASTGNTGAGLAGSHLQLNVGTLTVSSAGVGGVYLDAVNGIVIGSVADIGVTRVNADGSIASVTDAGFSDLVSAGNVVLVASTGSITITDGDADYLGVSAAGNLLLQAASDIVAGAALTSAGNVSLNAGRDIVQNANIVSTGAGKTVDLLAVRDIGMAAGTGLASSSGNIAAQAGNNVTVAIISAGTAGVRVVAGASVIDGANESGIFAGSLQLVAGNAIGAAANALDTTVTTLSAQAGGAIYLRETDGVTVDTVSVQVNRVDGRGVVAATVNAAQANLAAGGDLVLVTGGALVVSDNVSAAGSILLQATAGNITVNNAISTALGSVTLSASGAIAQKANIGSANTVSLSSGGAINMDDGVTTTAVGNVRYAAGGALALGSISSALDVSLLAASIVDSGAGDTDVVARSLRLEATGGAGTTGAHLQVAVTTLAAQVAGSLYVDGIGAIAIGSVGPVAVSRLAVDGSTSVVTDLALSGLTSAGGIELAAGSIAQAAQISTTGIAGSIVLVATGDITMAPAAASSTDRGAITYSALGQITLGLLDARSAVERASGAKAGQGGWGAVSLSAGGVLADTAGAVADVGVMASSLTINATAAGSSANALGTEIVNLVAHIGQGGLYLADTSSLALAAGGVTVAGDVALSAANELSVDGAVTVAGAVVLRAGAALVTHSGVTVAGNASFNAAQDVDLHATLAVGGALLLHAGATIAVNAGVTVAGYAVFGAAQDIDVHASAAVGGNLLLEAGGAILVHASVLSNGGSISLNAGSSVAQSAAITTLGQGKTIDLVAPGAIGMTGAASTSTNNGNVALHAHDISLGAIVAGTGSVSLVAANAISDGQNGSEAQFVKVQAAGLRMVAGAAIGSVANPIETAVDVLAAFAGSGDVALIDTNGLAVNAAGVSVSVNRVNGGGGASAVFDGALVGVTAPAGSIALAASSGAIVFDVPLASPAGRDVSVVGDTFVVNQPLVGAGGKLLIMPSNPALGIQIGGAAVDAAGQLYLDSASLANLKGGFDDVVIGAGSLAPGQDIDIDGRTVPVVFRDGLVLNVSGPGSVISVEGQLTADSLEARAAVTIVGVVTVTSGNGALEGGDMLFNENIDGATGNDRLTLAAGGDSIVFGGPIGATTALASLTINGAVDVSFADAVTVNGDVVINATGVVRFDSLLTLESGSLVIRGASEVIIGDVVLHAVDGQFIVQANTLTLNGDVNGAANVLLRPSDMARDIVVGGAAAGAFNISAGMLAHLSSADSLVIGVQGSDGHAAVGAGNVTLAPIDLGAITAAPVKVFGTSITLAQGAGSLQASSIVLDGRNGVVLHDSVAASAGDVVIYSGAGAIAMDAGTAVTSSAAVVLNAAGTLGVAQVNAQHVVLRSTSGGIVDVNGDNAVNVVAATVSLYGYGAPVGTGNPIEVQSPAIYLAARTGIELQDTGLDGRTHFYVLDGATMYEQAVGIGPVVRNTVDPTPRAVATSAAPVLAGGALSPFSYGATPAANSHSDVERYLAGAMSVQASGDQMSWSGIDGIDGIDAAALGLQAHGSAAASLQQTFDYWLEDLVV
ncbi:LEPR-XLL domain-containing protein [Massilia sp. TWP1-3-3]|uniref:LEPR-XLL domain-containing protein n=1 Tax=Massilia sp. TWP1-3-3 TaxID=2804573 RepID=UPI003CEEE80B